jgi:hypothetical protein
MSIDNVVRPLHNEVVRPGAAPVGKVRLLAFSYWFLGSKGKSNGVKNPRKASNREEQLLVLSY